MFKLIFWTVYIVLIPLYRVKFYGRENMPEGACVVCSNHTHFLDAIFVVLAIGKKGDYGVIGKAEAFKNKLLAKMLDIVHAFPVHRGKSDISAVKNCLKTLKEGKKLVIFPEGTRVKDGEDSEAKSGAAMFAIKTDSYIMPVYSTPKKRIFHRTEIVFGKPFKPEIEGKAINSDYRVLSDRIMSEIFKVGENWEMSKSCQ